MNVVSVQRWWKVVVDDSDKGAGVVVLVCYYSCCCRGCLLIVVFLVSSGDARCALLVRPRCYDGFHVLCDFGVLRLPANDPTLHCEQLREDDQHVLEHHQFHVSGSDFSSSSSASIFLSSRDFRRDLERERKIRFLVSRSRLPVIVLSLAQIRGKRIGTRAKRVPKRPLGRRIDFPRRLVAFE